MLAEQNTDKLQFCSIIYEPGGRDHLVDLGVDERIILKCILKKWDGRLDSSGSR
jgi:hypothetical protein